MHARTCATLAAAGTALLAACEPAPRTAELEPARPPAIDLRRAPAPAPAPPRSPVAGMARAVAVRVATDHLVPPTDEPRAYAVWLATLSTEDRAELDRRCAASGDWYSYACGGIGALHIPYPPHSDSQMMARPAPPHHQWIATEAAWFRALSGKQLAYYHQECDQYRNREYWNGNDLCGEGGTPLVVAFHDEPVAYTSGTTSFAFAPGEPRATDWPTTQTPWIALDRDGDGAITSGAELFGDHTAGGTYANGFAALAALDDNHDGVIDADDAAFARLVLWADADRDGRSSPGELSPLAASVVSISLADTLDVRCDARRNCEGQRAQLTWRDGTGALQVGSAIDVYLPAR